MTEGLLMELEDANCWTLAEALGHSDPHRPQHLLSRAVSRIVGWSAATTKYTELVPAALEMALWQRDRTGTRPAAGELTNHSDVGSQCTSFALAEHLDRSGIAASTPLDSLVRSILS